MVFGNIYDFIEQNAYTFNTVILHGNFHLLIWAGSGIFFLAFVSFYLSHKSTLESSQYNLELQRDDFTKNLCLEQF